MTKTIIATKEVEAVKKETAKALQVAEAIEITSEEKMQTATKVMSEINSIGKVIKERKEAITKPLNEALKSARDLFRPMEMTQTQAVGIIKTKMLGYHTKVEEERIAKQEKIEARVERGTMRMDTGMKKMEDIGVEQKTVKTESGSAQFRTVQKVYITDEKLVPREYLMLNMVLINRDAKAGKAIAGVEVKDEKTIANVL